MAKPIFQAALCNSDRIVLGVITIPLPLTQDEYEHSIGLLTEQQMGDAVKQDCYVDAITSEWPVLKVLEGQYVNVDELDYLAKRLDSFDDYEAEQFQAACSAFGCTAIKDLINMTFCCQETTVISDFSKLDEVGKQHYLIIHGGSAPSDELDAVDGKALAEHLIQSGEGKLTPYGLFFHNGMRMEDLYQGHGFPPYVWDERQAEVEVSRPDGSTASIFLPISSLEFSRFCKRNDIRLSEVTSMKLTWFNSSADPVQLSGEKATLRDYNTFCERLNTFPTKTQQKFFAAVEVIDAKDLPQMQLLASSMGDFDLLPGVSDAKSYGKYMIQKSGKYDYDESLDCYYNYEAFGEFLMEHEAGQVTKYGYLKCEERSAFLNFFAQESAPRVEQSSPQTLRDMISEHPDAAFHILSPDGYFDFTPEQAQALLNGGEALAHPGAAECFRKVDAEMLLEQFVIDENRDGSAFSLLTAYTPKMASQPKEREVPNMGTSMQMGEMH